MRFEYTLMMASICILIFGSLFIIAIKYESINITLDNSFINEYSECLQTVDELNKTLPICTDCKCDCGTNGFLSLLFSFLFGAFVMFIFYDSVILPRIIKKNKLTKRKER